MMAAEPIGRLAPSPTGAQHLGNARTFLITWLAARSRGARLILRIEDIDSPRIKPGAAAQLIEDFSWLGLDWDTGPIVQTDRLPAYQAALAQLQAANLVYPCTCSRTDIAQAASAPHLEHEGPSYPGTCAHRRVVDAKSLGDQPYAWRFRVTESPRFVDGFHGAVNLDLAQIGGDFVVWKAADSPAYQLAVVVDDLAMAITEVIRGDDLLPSTPRQLLLYQALGGTPPQFVHVPLVVGPDGRRLAKRHGDTRLAALRAAGVTAEAVVGLLAWSCGWLDKVVPISARELLARFDWKTIPHHPWVLTTEYLEWIGYRA